MSVEHAPIPLERYPYFAIVGGVGVGKSQLSELLGETFGVTVLREDFAPNPHLPLFYKEPKAHAFNSQMFFLTEEAKQMRPLVSRLETEPIFHDQFLEGDEFFEMILRWKFNFISADQHATYRSCAKALTRDNFLPKADIYIGVTASEETVVRRIKERNREMELTMLDRYPDYFPTIARAFKSWLKLLSMHHPVIMIDTDRLDFVNSDSAKAHVLDEVKDWSAYHLTSPYRLNLSGRDGARIILPEFLKTKPSGYVDITPGLSGEHKVLQRR